MRGELAADHVVGGPGIGLRADLEQVDEHAAALDVGEELVPEAGAVGGALDQAGDVGEHELALAVVDRAEHRLDRRERIVGDLRCRPRQPPEQRRLARVRQADEARVGEQLQVQLDPARGAGQPALGEARRLLGRRGEALVAVAAEPARRDDRPLAVGDEVEALAVEALDRRPRRHEDDQVLAPGAVLVGALPVAAALRPVVARDPHRGEVAARAVGDEDDVAAAPAVAAVGPAPRHVRLAAEGDDAVAAGTALHVHLCPILEHRTGGWQPGDDGPRFRERRQECAICAPAGAAASTPRVFGDRDRRGPCGRT